MRRNNDGRPEQEKEYLNRIYHSGYRMKTVIDDLLQYSRISHVPEQHKQEIDLNNIVREVLADLEVKIAQSGARMTSFFCPNACGSVIRGC